MISAFHVHELQNLHDHQNDRLVIEDIHLCPICEAVFEFDLDAGIESETRHLSSEEEILFQHQLFTQRIFTDKDGRSPPVFG